MVWFVPFVISIRERHPGAYARRATFALVLLASVLTSAAAQGGFNANTYYQQCLRFEAGGRPRDGASELSQRAQHPR